jgi:uncharacterized membrane protein (UPF0127 family)
MRSRTIASHLVTATGTHRLYLDVAGGFLSRLRGLMLAPPLPHCAGLLLTRCTCIHTCFMRQEIDLLYVDAGGMVVKCVPELAPWRISFGNGATGAGRTRPAAQHVVELRGGTIARLGIAPGSVIRHPAFHIAPDEAATATATVPDLSAGRERGSAMTEFIVVAPIMTVIGLAILQYGLLFFAKNQYNHAAFMAARAGSTGNASMNLIEDAYARALVPLYGGGVSTQELAASFAKAKADLAANAVIEMRNPTAESFSDWNDDDLQKTEGGGVHRVIPNGGLAMKKAAIVPGASGQSIQDANLLKLRITQGYKPQVPLIGSMYTRYLKWLDPGSNAVNTAQINRGLIPVVVHVTMHMQSDAIEGTSMSSPGTGNGGTPTDPGNPPKPHSAPPACETALCTGAANPPASGAGDPGQGGTAGDGSLPGGAAGGGTQPGGVCTAVGAPG